LSERSLRIQLCGRLVAERDGVRLEPQIPGRNGRRLFAFLVISRLGLVTRGEAARAVWGEHPPPSRDGTLNALLSRLRAVISITGTSELCVTLPPDAWVDIEAAHDAIHRAESALALGEPGRAWAASQVAMFTARRGLLPGEEGDWIEEQRRGLEELHLRALDAYASACLRIGGTELPAAERVGRELVRRQPFRESGYRQLMEALAARSNTAEALRVYEELRALLAGELGVAPSAATRELHARLLALV
jgi:DNA-binding SARP family transcriptional activator